MSPAPVLCRTPPRTTNCQPAGADRKALTATDTTWNRPVRQFGAGSEGLETTSGSFR